MSMSNVSNSSVTRLSKISPLWQIFDGISLFGKILSLLWQICDIIVLIFIVANDQNIEK